MVPGSITPTGCRLRTCVYEANEDGDWFWVPCRPEDVLFKATVFYDLCQPTAGVGTEDAEGPTETQLNVSPIPSALGLRIDFGAAHSLDPDIRLFDVSGREVKSIHRGRLTPGFHTFRWDGTDNGGRDVPSGVYFCRASWGSEKIVRKVVLIR